MKLARMRLERTTLEYWALIAEIAGAVAVVVSVIYLGLQISENTKVLRSQSHYNALALAQRPLEIMVENEGLAKIIRVCYATPDALTPEDWTRCGNYVFMQFNAWEYMYYQNADRAIPKQLWVGADAFFKDLVATKPGLARFWKEYAVAFDEPFRGYVTQEFAKKPTPARKQTPAFNASRSVLIVRMSQSDRAVLGRMPVRSA